MSLITSDCAPSKENLKYELQSKTQRIAELESEIRCVPRDPKSTKQLGRFAWAETLIWSSG